jgi:hypothetical protein
LLPLQPIINFAEKHRLYDLGAVPYILKPIQFFQKAFLLTTPLIIRDESLDTYWDHCQSLSKLSVHAPSPRLAFTMGLHPLGLLPRHYALILLPPRSTLQPQTDSIGS